MRNSSILLRYVSGLITGRVCVRSNTKYRTSRTVLRKVQRLGRRYSGLIVIAGRIFSRSIPSSPRVGRCGEVLNEVGYRVTTVTSRIARIVCKVTRRGGGPSAVIGEARGPNISDGGSKRFIVYRGRGEIRVVVNNTCRKGARCTAGGCPRLKLASKVGYSLSRVEGYITVGGFRSFAEH